MQNIFLKQCVILKTVQHNHTIYGICFADLCVYALTVASHKNTKNSSNIFIAFKTYTLAIEIYVLYERHIFETMRNLKNN
ncbi:hypothetical protein ECH_0765 [Ehrlichia chaffeensis str. Arkansas]|uniref:Uncharacterized protein n=1 Tax=Ehrlichia chaffeensis (strain ATCC CRL-10679 / Arkansas) TaxID=205920 RepID=Q2GG70_EHRCR|nr:hypothetical protein ECH_0765 [Ehrlichia chaffeensis str. Arkansas]